MTHPTCEECGGPLDGEEEFTARAEMLDDALDGIEDPTMELVLIAGVAGEFLAKVPAEHRAEVREALIEAIDEEARETAIRMCDA